MIPRSYRQAAVMSTYGLYTRQERALPTTWQSSSDTFSSIYQVLHHTVPGARNPSHRTACYATHLQNGACDNVPDGIVRAPRVPSVYAETDNIAVLSES